MSGIARRDRAPVVRGASVSRFVARLVERPDAIDAVRALSGAELHALVSRVGLEDAGELLSLASAAQLVVAFDDDLFRAAAPADDEAFDVARFLVWLEVLRESGDIFAAERLAALSDDFLVLVVARCAVVLDQDALAAVLAEDRDLGDRVDALVEAMPTEEIDRFLLVAKVREGWDALVAVLVTMDQDHHPTIARVLERVAEVGLASVVDADDDAPFDGLFDDVAAEREERRHARGFVTPADARAFLASAREGLYPANERDPVSRAVLRDMARARGDEVPREAPSRAPSTDLARAPGPRSLRAQLEALLRESHALYMERVDELAYVVNALVAGASFEGRAPRPVEAYELVVATVDLALDLAPALDLASTPADVVFRRGLHALHVELVLPAARRAHARLVRARGAASEASRALGAALERGRPWIARDTFLDATEATKGSAEARRLADLFDVCPHERSRFFTRIDDARAALAPKRRPSSPVLRG